MYYEWWKCRVWWLLSFRFSFSLKLRFWKWLLDSFWRVEFRVLLQKLRLSHAFHHAKPETFWLYLHRLRIRRSFKYYRRLLTDFLVSRFFALLWKCLWYEVCWVEFFLNILFQYSNCKVWSLEMPSYQIETCWAV